jgi:hypothetical protein
MKMRMLLAFARTLLVAGILWTAGETSGLCRGAGLFGGGAAGV